MRRITLLAAALSCAAVLAIAGTAPAAGRTKLALSNPHPRLHKGAKLRRLALHGDRRGLARLNAPVTFCGGDDNPNAGTDVQQAAMKCLVNFARAQAGLPQLSGSGALDSSAGNKAGDIIRCNQFSHQACGRDFTYWLRRAGYIGASCWWAGENIAWGTGPLGTPRSIMNAWMHSPPHRANILGSQFRDFGISLRIGSLSGRSNAHVWVNHFGRHC
jgi:uncharacterized protein YkwD